MLKTEYGWCAIALVAVGCSAFESERNEPPPAMGACWIPNLVCNQQPGPSVIDGTDPLWSFCHDVAPRSFASSYSYGAAEVAFTYHVSGELERIELGCDQEGPPFAAVAERDDADRVVRWSYTTPKRGNTHYPATDLVYDASGMLVESDRRSFRDDGTEVIRDLAFYGYRDDGNLAELRSESFLLGTPHWGSFAWDLEYDETSLARVTAVSLFEDCPHTVEYERDSGRVTRMVQSGSCSIWEGQREYTYEWSDDRLVRGRFVLDAPQGFAEDEIRYTYEDGRIAEVQRDRDGEPFVTYWLDYDEEGRLAHLLWWGHDPDPDVWH